MYPTNHCPSSIRRRALINEYISHHNESTRMMTRKVIRPGLTGVVASAKNPGNLSPSRTHSLSRSPDDLMKLKSTIRDVSKRFQHKFLVNSRESSDFIVGDTVSIADLLAYPELAQIPQLLGIKEQSRLTLENNPEKHAYLAHNSKRLNKFHLCKYGRIPTAHSFRLSLAP